MKRKPRYFESLEDVHWFLMAFPNGDLLCRSICVIPKNSRQCYVQVMAIKHWAIIPL